MGAGCCSEGCSSASGRFRAVLRVALAINALMFVVEAVAGAVAGSSSLQADSLDFLVDALNYAVSLFVLERSAGWRSKAALLKGACMGLFGLGVLGNTVRHLLGGTVPMSDVMGVTGFVALAANGGVAFLLYATRERDANSRSVWLCARNDAVGNLAVLAAAGGVAVTHDGAPDIAVAAIIAGLALTGSVQTLRHALAELRGAGG